MKLTIERAALLKALGHVQSVVERRNTIPILSNVLMCAKPSGLSLSATDLYMDMTEETRYYLTGIYLHSLVEDGREILRAVATDGHRLALAEMPAPEGASGAPGVIIPRKTIQEARRLLEDSGESIDLRLSQQKARF